MKQTKFGWFFYNIFYGDIERYQNEKKKRGTD